MAQHLIDRPLRLAACVRCSAPILAGMSSGVRVAVDPVPFGHADIASKILSGCTGVYRVVEGNRGRMAARVTAAALTSPSAPYGTYLADHPCGTSAQDAKLFEEREPVPPQAPATSGRPATAPSGAGAPEAATSATYRRSRPPVRCSRCRGLIPPEAEDVIMVEWPVWQENTLHVHARGKGKNRMAGYDRVISGWGYARWAVHSAGCPARTTTT